MDSGGMTIYRGCTPVVDTKYGADRDQSPAEAIVAALAAASGVDPIDLPPLYEYVDPDAIDELFTRNDGQTNTDTILSFQIDTWNVFVRDDGRIRVCDATRRIEPEPVFASTVA